MSLIDVSPIGSSLLLSIAINFIFFLIAFCLKTDKVTDLSYSFSFLLITPILLLSSGWGFTAFQLWLGLVIMLWAFRLGAYLFIRILLTGTDERFDDKRNNPLRLIAFWILQIIAVWLVMMPFAIFLPLRPAQNNLFFTAAGFTIACGGLLIETISDYQKFCFRKNKTKKGLWIQKGLWRYSRHPNYFGEILFWWGLFVVVQPSLKGWQLLSVVGPLSITVLLLFVSGIPLLEKSAQAKYGSNPDYIKYKDNTRLLIPLPLKVNSKTQGTQGAGRKK